MAIPTEKIDELTEATINGSGVFDVLMRALDTHLDKQYLSGRIKGADYATVYLGGLQAVLQQSIAYITTVEQIAASQANTALKQQLGDAQTALYERQTLGFDDDAQYKVYKTLMDLRTTGITQEIAGLVNDVDDGLGGVNQLTNAILTKVGITGVTNIVADVV